MSILIVEDEPLIAMSVESGLQDAGAAVVKIAASISAAHSVIDAENSFDAAVVDLALSGQQRCVRGQHRSPKEKSTCLRKHGGAKWDRANSSMSHLSGSLPKAPGSVGGYLL